MYLDLSLNVFVYKFVIVEFQISSLVSRVIFRN